MKSKSTKEQMAIRTTELAKTIPGETGTFVLGVLVAVTIRFLPEDYKKRLLEVLKMTEIEQWIREERDMEIAKAVLAKGSTVEFVVDITGLSRETVLKLKSEVEQERLQAVSQ